MDSHYFSKLLDNIDPNEYDSKDLIEFLQQRDRQRKINNQRVINPFSELNNCFANQKEEPSTPLKAQNQNVNKSNPNEEIITNLNPSILNTPKKEKKQKGRSNSSSKSNKTSNRSPLEGTSQIIPVSKRSKSKLLPRRKYPCEISKFTPEDYGLFKNPYFERIVKDPNCRSKMICHRYLPPKYRNDDQYKGKLVNFIRSKRLPSGKTDKCKQALFLEQAQKFDGNLSTYGESLLLNYGTLRRRKVAKSTRKLYQSEICLFSRDGTKNYFKVYRDSDIGFTEMWQRKLIDNGKDDDVMTEDGAATYAARHCVNELEDAIQLFKSDPCCCNNHRLYQNKNNRNDDLDIEMED